MMKLPKINLHVKFKWHVGLMINVAMVLIILIEIYFAYSLLYKNLNPKSTEIILNKIVKVDLKAYQDTTELIKNLQEFSPEALLLENQNPFKFNF